MHTAIIRYFKVDCDIMCVNVLVTFFLLTNNRNTYLMLCSATFSSTLQAVFTSTLNNQNIKNPQVIRECAVLILRV